MLPVVNQPGWIQAPGVVQNDNHLILDVGGGVVLLNKLTGEPQSFPDKPNQTGFDRAWETLYPKSFTEDLKNHLYNLGVQTLYTGKQIQVCDAVLKTTKDDNGWTLTLQPQVKASCGSLEQVVALFQEELATKGRRLIEASNLSHLEITKISVQVGMFTPIIEVFMHTQQNSWVIEHRHRLFSVTLEETPEGFSYVFPRGNNFCAPFEGRTSPKPTQKEAQERAISLIRENIQSLFGAVRVVVNK